MGLQRYEVDDLKRMGREIKIKMLEKNLSVTEVSRALGVDYQTVVAWRGGVQKPSRKNIAKLENLIGMDFDKYLVEYETEKPEGCIYPNCLECGLEDCEYIPLEEMDIEDMEEEMKKYPNPSFNQKLYHKWYYEKNREKIVAQRKEHARRVKNEEL